jgi:EmrB/QacA subfamily drug resistance transporter
MERKWWTLIIVNVATFMLLLDVTIVNVALPSIQEDLGTTFTELQWVVDAYALALATLTLVAGSLGDRLGRRRVFEAGLVVFTIASALCAIAPSPLTLDLARFLQGAGGATMFSVTLAIIAQEFQGAELGKAMGFYGATIGLGVAIGPLVGGALTESLGWEWVFYLNVPIGIAAVALTRRFVRESRNERASAPDWLGTALFSGMLFMLVFALLRGNGEGWGSPLIVALLAGAAVTFAAFIAVELRSSHPMLPLSNFRNPAFTGTHIGAFALSASLFALFLYLTLYMQNILGLSPLEAGVRFLPTTVVSFFAAPLAGAFLGRLAPRVFFGVGILMVALGLLLMHGVSEGDSWTTLLAGFVVSGFGVGLTNPAIASTAVATVGRQEAGLGAGVSNTFRQVGLSTGIAALGAVFQSRSINAGLDALHGTPVAPGRGHALLERIASGDATSVLKGLSPGEARFVGPAARHGFIVAFNEILLIGSIVAAVGAVAAFLLLRGFELPSHGAPPQAGGAAEGGESPVPVAAGR